MLTLCHEVCVASPSQVPGAGASSGSSAPSGTGLRVEKRSSSSGVGGHIAQEPFDSQKRDATSSSKTFDTDKSDIPLAGPFGVMRGVAAQNGPAYVCGSDQAMEAQLRLQIQARREEVERLQREDEKRRQLVIGLEREAFEKDQNLEAARAEIARMATSFPDSLSSDSAAATSPLHSTVTNGLTPSKREAMAVQKIPSVQSLDGQRERLQEALRAQETEAARLRQHLASLEESVREKRLEATTKARGDLSQQAAGELR